MGEFTSQAAEGVEQMGLNVTVQDLISVVFATMKEVKSTKKPSINVEFGGDGVIVKPKDVGDDQNVIDDLNNIMLIDTDHDDCEKLVNFNTVHLTIVMHFYTFYCALLICFAQVFPHDFPDEVFTKEYLECMKKLELNKQDVNNMMDKDFFIAKGNSKTNEYIECCAMSKKLIGDSGEINRDVLYHDVFNIVLPLLKKTKDSEVANKIIDECIDNLKDNSADRFVNLHNCIVNAAKKYGK
ncbi:hypothetical protein RN001_000011 [Aquatica leii]|uniref:Uncharacterized protein n=1 Tax=Aquatica leii TaxID=1421715 RepID=A0AAN7SSD2_9COLE|nr:hypothetical protein RN001_000011 [Aquatica leii]